MNTNGTVRNRRYRLKSIRAESSGAFASGLSKNKRSMMLNSGCTAAAGPGGISVVPELDEGAPGIEEGEIRQCGVHCQGDAHAGELTDQVRRATCIVLSRKWGRRRRGAVAGTATPAA